MDESKDVMLNERRKSVRIEWLYVYEVQKQKEKKKDTWWHRSEYLGVGLMNESRQEGACWGSENVLHLGLSGCYTKYTYIFVKSICIS